LSHTNLYRRLTVPVCVPFKNFLRSGFGFPRFKGAKRFDSFTYPQTGFSLGGRRLSLAKIGNVKVFEISESKCREETMGLEAQIGLELMRRPESA
jgi:hypothetical protein